MDVYKFLNNTEFNHLFVIEKNETGASARERFLIHLIENGFTKFRFHRDLAKWLGISDRTLRRYIDKHDQLKKYKKERFPEPKTRYTDSDLWKTKKVEELC